MSIPKRRYFNSSTEMDEHILDLCFALPQDKTRLVLRQVRSTYSRLSFHPGRAQGGQFSMTTDYTSGEVRLEYKHTDGRMRSRRVPDVHWRKATPFELLGQILQLNLLGYRRLYYNGMLDYDGRVSVRRPICSLAHT